jgi:branched-chain amino acid transport system ATP-binding protein
MALLKATEIRVRFGGLLALADVSFSLLPGEIVGLIGPNGAGKTTVFNVITGVYKTSGGDVQYENQSLLGKRPYEILSLGIARTFQTIRLFNNMTAIENAMVAQHCRSKRGVIGAILRTRSQKNEEQSIRDRAREALNFMGVEQYADEVAQNLPYGLQRRLEIARALATQPKIMLLDEPSLGLAPLIVQKIFEIIDDINKRNQTTILLVEQNANLALQTAERGYVLETGRIVMEDDAKILLNDPRIRKAYLGE